MQSQSFGLAMAFVNCSRLCCYRVILDLKRLLEVFFFDFQPKFLISLILNVIVIVNSLLFVVIASSKATSFENLHLHSGLQITFHLVKQP